LCASNESSLDIFGKYWWFGKKLKNTMMYKGFCNFGQNTNFWQFTEMGGV